MPTTSAAAKAYRQNLKARARNNTVKHTIKKLFVQFRKAVAAKQMDAMKKTSAELIKTLDKASQKKIVSRNTAARRKSRLLAALKKASA